MGEQAEALADTGARTEARVRLYGCLRPTVNQQRVREQLEAAHAYQNQLIALERCRRQHYRALRREHCNLGPLEEVQEARRAELEDLRAQIRALRAKERRRVVPKDLTERAQAVYKSLREVSTALREERERTRDNADFRAAVHALEERTGVWQRALRKLTPTYWGTYVLVEASMDQARRGQADPRFKRFTGEGRVGVQIQGGMTVEELFAGTDTRLRIVPAERRWQGKATSARGLRSKVRFMLHMRIGSTGPSLRAPLWAVFPLILHRPLPEDAIIKGATVRVRKLGLSERWTVALLYTREAVPMPAKAGVVALDLGWRKRPDESLRVAYWVDDAGRSGDIRMPARVRARLRHASSLREIQDRRFNRMLAGLRRWLRVASERLALPAFLADAAPHLDKWRAHRRLHQLIETWRRARFAGDTQIFEALLRWRVKSHHLYAWECHERSRALGYRREVYRIAAARFARHYGTVVFEDFDLKRAKRRHEPEEAPDAPRAHRAQLQASAPGEFRLAVTQAVEREGGLVVRLPAAGTTTSCHACGAVCTWDGNADIWHTCEHCGAMWDQDANAARNLLALWKRAPITPKKVARAPRIRKRAKETDASKQAKAAPVPD